MRLAACDRTDAPIAEAFSLIRESALGHFLAFALTTNAIVPTDLVFAEKAKRAPPDARSRRSRISRSEAGFVHVKARQAFPGNLAAKFVDANKRRFGGFAMAAC